MSVLKKKDARIRRFLKYREKFKKLKSIRLVVHRSSRNIYAQIISSNNFVVVSASTLEKNIKKNICYPGNKKSAKLIGKKIALRSLKNGIDRVSFDRSGFKYHGRIKELAESARKYGLKF
ncbi:50S ribosomal protein L18 [Buchnera aphidicola (Ceratovacuna keduensis)]|uniref:50S ribosomal protein L18 n=1 Tax=Buchnera aphidicola TaxID=9 RepID=UPI0031B86AAC